MIRKTVITILLALAFTTQLPAQNISPGGVSGVLYWNKSQKSSDNKVTWQYLGENGFVKSTAGSEKQSGEINHHPAMYFDGNVEMYFPPKSSMQFSELTFFSVSKPANSKEQAIWSIEKESQSNLVLTTNRFADLSGYNYINFEENKQTLPQIHSYTRRQTARDTVGTSQLRVGGQLSRKDIPVQAFKGLIPEIIVFDRVLSYNERQRVESYLALKYGVSLQQTYPTSYLDSEGKIIWNAVKNTAYANSIAGIGRDDQSGLNQLTSSSSNSPDLMEIQCKQELDNKTFLIWGDNGEKLVFEKMNAGGRKLKRVWRNTTSRATFSIHTSLNFAANQFQEMYPLNTDEQYWLIVDHSGTGKYPMDQVSYYRNESTTNQNNILFNDVVWNKNKAEELFTLIAAPDFFAGISLDQPQCQQDQTGIVSLQIVGGEAPFTLQLRQGSKTVKTLQTNDRNLKIADVEQGLYTLLVKDVNQKQYTEDFTLSNADIPQILEFEPIYLLANEIQYINASQGVNKNLNLSYQWQTPEGNIVSDAKIELEESGKYLLTVTNKNGCSTLRSLNVIRDNKNSIFEEVKIYPNPTADGWIDMAIQLKKESIVQIIISSLNGQIINQQKLKASDYYKIKYQFPAPGIWIIQLQSNGDSQSYKIIYQN